MPAILAQPLQATRIPHLSWSKIQLYLTCDLPPGNESR
jgi:hypothetical protein